MKPTKVKAKQTPNGLLISWTPPEKSENAVYDVYRVYEDGKKVLLTTVDTTKVYDGANGAGSCSYCVCVKGGEMSAVARVE